MFAPRNSRPPSSLVLLSRDLSHRSSLGILSVNDSQLSDMKSKYTKGDHREEKLREVSVLEKLLDQDDNNNYSKNTNNPNQRISSNSSSHALSSTSLVSRSLSEKSFLSLYTSLHLSLDSYNKYKSTPFFHYIRNKILIFDMAYCDVETVENTMKLMERWTGIEVAVIRDGGRGRIRENNNTIIGNDKDNEKDNSIIPLSEFDIEWYPHSWRRRKLESPSQNTHHSNASSSPPLDPTSPSTPFLSHHFSLHFPLFLSHHSSHLIHLELLSPPLYDKKSFHSLVTHIPKMKKLKYFSLSHYNIPKILTESIFDNLLSALSTLSSLHYLTLSHCELNEKYGKIIRKYLHKQAEKRDNLHWAANLRRNDDKSAISSPSKSDLLSIRHKYKLITMEGIISLTLSHNRLLDFGVADILSILQNDQWVQNVNLKYNGVSREGIGKVVEMMKCNPYMVKVEVAEEEGESNVHHQEISAIRQREYRISTLLSQLDPHASRRVKKMNHIYQSHFMNQNHNTHLPTSDGTDKSLSYHLSPIFVPTVPYYRIMTPTQCEISPDYSYHLIENTFYIDNEGKDSHHDSVQSAMDGMRMMQMIVVERTKRVRMIMAMDTMEEKKGRRRMKSGVITVENKSKSNKNKGKQKEKEDGDRGNGHVGNGDRNGKQKGDSNSQSQVESDGKKKEYFNDISSSSSSSLPRSNSHPYASHSSSSSSTSSSSPPPPSPFLNTEDPHISSLLTVISDLRSRLSSSSSPSHVPHVEMLRKIVKENDGLRRQMKEMEREKKFGWRKWKEKEEFERKNKERKENEKERERKMEMEKEEKKNPQGKENDDLIDDPSAHQNIPIPPIDPLTTELSHLRLYVSIMERDIAHQRKVMEDKEREERRKQEEKDEMRREREVEREKEEEEEKRNERVRREMKRNGDEEEEEYEDDYEHDHHDPEREGSKSSPSSPSSSPPSQSAPSNLIHLDSSEMESIRLEVKKRLDEMWKKVEHDDEE